MKYIFSNRSGCCPIRVMKQSKFGDCIPHNHSLISELLREGREKREETLPIDQFFDPSNHHKYDSKYSHVTPRSIDKTPSSLNKLLLLLRLEVQLNCSLISSHFLPNYLDSTPTRDRRRRDPLRRRRRRRERRTRRRTLRIQKDEQGR